MQSMSIDLYKITQYWMVEFFSLKCHVIWGIIVVLSGICFFAFDGINLHWECYTSIFHYNKMCPIFSGLYHHRRLQMRVPKTSIEFRSITHLQINVNRTGNGFKHFPICIIEFEINERSNICGLLCSTWYF